MQFEDNKLSFSLHEEGRVIPEPQTGKLVYEYHYKDHLGNLRVAFRQRSQAETHSSLTLEPVLAASEEASFDNVDQSRVAGVAHSGRYSARVMQGIGPAKQVQLEAGEKLQVKVFGHVEAEGKHKISFLPLPIVGDVPAGGENSKRKLAIKGGVLVPLNWVHKKSDQPAAYLEIVASDSSGKVVHAERKSLTAAASESWEELSIAYQASSKETVVIQLVNPSEIAIVHFDDMTISQEPPLIVQENHYDPWGLNLVGIEQQGSPDHKYQYNGKEKQEELGLAWSDYGARMYDAQIGRWHVVDPMAGIEPTASPFAYVNNNPVILIDPTGMLSRYNWDSGNYYDDKDGDGQQGEKEKNVAWDQVHNELEENKSFDKETTVGIANEEGFFVQGGETKMAGSFSQTRQPVWGDRLDEQSFVFSKRGRTNWQEAGITDLFMMFTDFENPNHSIVKKVILNNMTIGLPLVLSDKTIISSKYATEKTTVAANMAAFYTSLWLVANKRVLFDYNRNEFLGGAQQKIRDYYINAMTTMMHEEQNFFPLPFRYDGIPQARVNVGILSSVKYPTKAIWKKLFWSTQ